MENLINYKTELFLVLSIIVLLIFYFFENKENVRIKTESSIYIEKYQELRKDLLSFTKEHKNNLSIVKETVEITKELQRDYDDLNDGYSDILEKLEYQRKRAEQLQKQVKYLQRKCKNNKIK